MEEVTIRESILFPSRHFRLEMPEELTSTEAGQASDSKRSKNRYQRCSLLFGSANWHSAKKNAAKLHAHVVAWHRIPHWLEVKLMREIGVIPVANEAVCQEALECLKDIEEEGGTGQLEMLPVEEKFFLLSELLWRSRATAKALKRAGKLAKRSFARKSSSKKSQQKAAKKRP